MTKYQEETINLVRLKLGKSRKKSNGGDTGGNRLTRFKTNWIVSGKLW